jgi:hypothetical protein
MVTSYLEDKIVVIDMEGEFLASELLSETDKWAKNEDEYIGYMVDISKVTKHAAMEQRKAEAGARKVESLKPRAVVGKDNASAKLISIYIRFTKAEGMRYFAKRKEAKDWLLSLN